jgi:hemerythrin-like metal-binding protein
MPALEFNEPCFKGDKILHTLHEELLDITDRLHDKCDNGEWESLSSVLKELHKYVNYNFLAEEEYMSQRAYEGINAHIIEHRYFELRIQEVIAYKACRSVNRLRILITLLSTWLLHHINEEDSKVF